MGRPHPRRMNERQLRRLLNFYPPFLFQRIRVVEIGPGFRHAKVRVRKSLFNRNHAGTIFGGSIFAAADPIYAVLYWQALAREGLRVHVWLKSASIRYLKPAASDLTLEFALTDRDLAEARDALASEGRFARRFAVEAIDAGGEPCALVETEVYVGMPGTGERSGAAGAEAV